MDVSLRSLNTRSCRAGILLAVSVTFLYAGRTAAGLTPAQQCYARKMKASQKYFACLVKEYVKSETVPGFTDYDCDTKLYNAFSAADIKGGLGCPTQADADVVLDPLAFDASALNRYLQGGTCGNGRKDYGEQCDGDAGGATCMDVGFSYGLGSLGCNVDCTFNTASCTNDRFFLDGLTVLDLQSGLEWEVKTDAGANPANPHAQENQYTWGDLAGCSYQGCPNGTVFTDFLGRLNNCGADGYGGSAPG